MHNFKYIHKSQSDLYIQINCGHVHRLWNINLRRKMRFIEKFCRLSFEHVRQTIDKHETQNLFPCTFFDKLTFFRLLRREFFLLHSEHRSLGKSYRKWPLPPAHIRLPFRKHKLHHNVCNEQSNSRNRNITLQNISKFFNKRF